jgi:hypothetical protein
LRLGPAAGCSSADRFDRYIGTIYRCEPKRTPTAPNDRTPGGRVPELAFDGVKLGLAAAVQRRPGEIDYRLERQRVLAAFRAGAQSELAVCDAHVELRRNAEHCGTPSDEPCPICDDGRLNHVTYVFGPRLPAGGRCITSRAELARLSKRKAPYTAYVVEVCVACGWNHLVRSFLLNPLS